MSGFITKKKPVLRLAVPSPVFGVVAQTIEEKSDTGIVSRVVKVPIDLTSKEAAASLPDAKEYTLEKLLDAGVPLQQLPVNGMLDSTDVAFNALHADVKLNSLVSEMQKNDVVESSKNVE